MIKTKEGFSLIHAAAVGGSIKIFEYVLKHSFSLSEHVVSGEQQGFTALKYAQMCGHNDIIERIIDKRGERNEC